MSIDASRWAWTQQVDPSLKIVLLSLADRADEDGYCYPSMARLVLDASQSESDIKEALINLEKAGLITITEDNTYFLKMGAL